MEQTETDNEIIKRKGNTLEVRFKKGLSSDEFTKWLEDNNLVKKEQKKNDNKQKEIDEIVANILSKKENYMGIYVKDNDKANDRITEKVVDILEERISKGYNKAISDFAEKIKEELFKLNGKIIEKDIGEFDKLVSCWDIQRILNKIQKEMKEK